MNRTVIAWIVAGVLAVGGAAFAYVFYFAGGSGEPSTELTTPEVVASTTTTLERESTTATSAPSTTAASTPPTTAEGSVAETSYVVDSEQSTASFVINEVLRGEPTEVVGTTDQVAGQVVVDPSDLGVTQFSDVVINARTFETGSTQRNRAIRGPVILDSGSDEHELITFTPTAIDGLDGVEATDGETYEFTVTGDLMVKGVTNPVTFDVTVDLVDFRTIEGRATAEILRSDFDIGIPSVPFVADVTDEVTLILEFVATAG